MPDDIRYKGPRGGVTPKHKKAELDGQLDDIREQIEIAEEEREMFQIMLEGTEEVPPPAGRDEIEEIPELLEEDWVSPQLDELDRIRIEGYDIEIEALREVEADLKRQLDDLFKERKGYTYHKPETFKDDIELLGKSGTRDLIDNTRTKLFAQERATLNEEIALLKKELNEANRGARYADSSPEYAEMLDSHFNALEDHLGEQLQKNKSAMEQMYDIGYTDEVEDADFLDWAIYHAKTSINEKDHTEEAWSTLAKSISEEEPYDW